MNRFRVRKERDGAIIYDRLTRKSIHTTQDLFQPSHSSLELTHTIRDLMGVEPDSSSPSVDFIDTECRTAENGAS